MTNTYKKEYLKVNKDSWNSLSEINFKSDFYDVEAFLNGKSSLNSIELVRFGDLKNKKVLHLQCHFGQDSISMARMGAQVTGVDLSDKAIQLANELAKKDGSDARFICCDVYDLPNHLDEEFDIVYTSYGVIGWLPDMNKWAEIISRFLKPGGKFVFVEFHPVVWMFDDAFKEITYNYFNDGEIIETEEGAYADREAQVRQEYICWNHSISEVVNSLISNKLEITALDEFDYSPYNCFRNTEKIATQKYRIAHLGNKIPMVYAIEAVKKG